MLHCIDPLRKKLDRVLDAKEFPKPKRPVERMNWAIDAGNIVTVAWMYKLQRSLYICSFLFTYDRRVVILAFCLFCCHTAEQGGSLCAYLRSGATFCY